MSHKKTAIVILLAVISAIFIVLFGSNDTSVPNAVSYSQIVNNYQVKIYGDMTEREVEEVYAVAQAYSPENERISFIRRYDDSSYEVSRVIYEGGDCNWSYGTSRTLLLKTQHKRLQVVSDHKILWDNWNSCTPTPTPIQTPIVVGKLYQVPEKPAGWQEIPAEQKHANNIGFYFPSEWVTMTTQPTPTIIFCLDPTFFPNCELRVYDIPDGTTNIQFREIIKHKYPAENGGEYTGFQVLEEGEITLDNGFQTVYMIHKGTRMGYDNQALDVFMIRGRQGFVIQAVDSPVTFEDHKPLAMQIVKTLYSTIPIPDKSSGTSTPTPN